MINSYLVTKIFLAALFLKALIQAYLESRNRKHIIVNGDQVPPEFAEKITLEQHRKARDYSIAKISSSKIFRNVNLIILLGWTLGGGLQFLDYKLSMYDDSPILKGVVVFAFFSVISALLNLPQSLYQTFSLEERFGFNKTTPKTFALDLTKGMALGGMIGLPLFAALLWFVESTGTYWWLYAWLFFSGFQLVLVWIYPIWIAPLFNKFVKLEDPEIVKEVENLLDETGFKSKGLFVMDASRRSSHGNAYFTGFGKNKRIVFFDTLIKQLNPSEIRAILAHELGHFKYKHILKGIVLSLLFSLAGFFILGQLYQSEVFFQGHGITRPSPHLALIVFALVSPIYTFLLTPIFSSFSRKNEYQADSFASSHARSQDLIEALVKLYRDNASTLTPDPLYCDFYFSHPPAIERIAHLKNLELESPSRA